MFASIHFHPEAWRDIFLCIAALPLVYYAAATIAALRFFSRERRRKMPLYTPPVSLLKPVRGLDFGSYENFRSFCTQDYPEYEILFAVNEDSDPAVPVIQRIIAEFPERKIRLLSNARKVGSNKKVNNLILLASEAAYETLSLTDGDIRVSPQYLRETVAPFADQSMGAVTSFYNGIAEKNLPAQLEAIGAASDFFAGVLMADWMEGVSFALGASIVTTKTWLKKIGGLESIADMHSDDYELGHRIALAGGRVELSREVVSTMYPALTLGGFWDHQVRWARTVRLCRPASYFGLLFTHGLPWAILAALVAPTWFIAAAYLLGYVVLRLWMGWTVGVWGVHDASTRSRLWLIPFRDAINFIVWLASFGSSRISWGGETFTMQKGKMVPVPPSRS